MITLTKEQHDALASNGQEPVKSIDPVTNTEYLLVRADVCATLMSELSRTQSRGDFEKAASSLFTTHEEILRRLANTGFPNAFSPRDTL